MIFFFNDTATTEIYTLSLHDALPILPPHPVRPPRLVDGQVEERGAVGRPGAAVERVGHLVGEHLAGAQDRKSTRLNSSHANISYAVFCLKKKKENIGAVVRRS